jgi:hypothetical protein
MNLLVPWLVFPLVLLVLAFGCGLLVEQASGLTLPWPLLPPLGLALVIVEADLVTMTGSTAQLATPLAAALAIAGYGLGWRRGRRPDGWSIGAAAGVFAVYAAPIVLSGKATFAGYVSLDDTSTWLTLTDRVMTHGRTLGGLAPSTYQQVLADYFGSGYPLGAFLPLGIGGKLTGTDIAWLFQPTIAFYGAMLALAIYAASERLISSRALRAFTAFLAAQPALLFAYSLWSGIKEMAAAAMIALVCAAIAATIDRWQSTRAVLPSAVAVAALFAILSPAGAVWLVVPALIVVAVLVRRGLRPAIRSAVVLAAFVMVLSIPSVSIARAFLKGATGGEITSSSEVANLGHPLDAWQIFGIWPATDFRSSPHAAPLTYILIATLIAAALVGLALAWRRRSWGLPLYVSTCAGGAALLFALDRVGLSSPWLIAKGMAEASPALVAAAVAGVAALFELGRRTEAAVIGTAIAAGVLWSNALAYSNAWLAPRGQLAELQTIGRQFAGDGPTLMTDAQPYGVRHFLRNMDAEGTSERRRRLIPLLDGQGLPKGQYADLDRFQLGGILVYKTLVLPHSPVASRPPSVYRLVRTGGYYDVWQRSDTHPTIVDHLPLGNAEQPGAVPRCADVLRLAAKAGPTGRLAAVPRAPVTTVDLSSGTYPRTWTADSSGRLHPRGGGDLALTVDVPRAGRYDLWLGGSFRSRLRVYVDGRLVSEPGAYFSDGSHEVPLGKAFLSAGSHGVLLSLDGPDLRPGSGGYSLAMGPLRLSTSTSVDSSVVSVNAAEARSLCGKRLDWIEAVHL